MSQGNTQKSHGDQYWFNTKKQHMRRVLEMIPGQFEASFLIFLTFGSTKKKVTRTLVRTWNPGTVTILQYQFNETKQRTPSNLENFEN